jgi:hypothetical protein
LHKLVSFDVFVVSFGRVSKFPGIQVSVHISIKNCLVLEH